MKIRMLKKGVLFILLVITIILSCVSTGYVANIKLVTEEACFYFDGNNGDIIGISYPFPGIISGIEEIYGGVFVIDGITKEEVAFSQHGCQVQDDCLLFLKRDNKGLSFSEKISALDDRISFVFELNNQSQEQRFLEPGVVIEKKMADPWYYWNGLNVFQGKSDFTSSLNKLDNAFPVASIFNETEGLAIGIEPLQLLSYLASSSSSEDGENVSLKYSTRVVLDPGQSATIEFIMYAFSPFQQERSAIQKYYELYPEVFRPNPNIDKRISLNCAEYYAVWWHTEATTEICERAFAGWDWWYAPYKRSGDIYGHPELWDFEIAYPPITNIAKGTIEEFHQARKDVLNTALGSNVLPLFFVPSGIWAEETLINDYYPDAKVVDGRGDNYISKWTLPHTNDVRVFPYGNDYADALYHDMELVVQELDLAGFAFDTADGNRRIYQGTVTGVEKIPIRAYDDAGRIYVEQATAIALLMDHAHSFKNSKGDTLGIVANPNGMNYMIAFRTDAAIIEKYPWMGQFRKNEGFPERDLLGQKTYVWWHNWSANHWGKFLLDGLSTEDRADAFEGMQDQLILRSLTWGMLPPAQYLFDVNGEQRAPKLENALPLIVELTLTGLQATTGISPVSMPPLERGEIWISRFQNKEKIYLVVANASLDVFNEPLFVNNPQLGNYNYVFADYSGKQLKNIISGTKTQLNPNLASRDYLVAQRVLGIKEMNNSQDLEFTVTKNNNLGITRVEFDSTSQITTTFSITVPNESIFLGAFLNGVKINTVSCGDNEYIFDATIFPKDVIEIKVAPRI